MKSLYLTLSLLTVAVIGSAIAVVDARHHGRSLFGELQTLTRERDEFNIEWGRLQLEHATWADINRIEQIAVGEMGFVFPDPAMMEMVEP